MGPFVTDVVDFHDAGRRQLILEAKIPVLHIRHVVVDVVVEGEALAVRLGGALVRKHAGEAGIRILDVPQHVFGKTDGNIRRIQIDGAVEAQRTAESETVGDRRSVVDSVTAAKHQLGVHGIGKAELRRELPVVRIAGAAFSQIVHERQRARPVAGESVRFGEVDLRDARRQLRTGRR